MVIIKKDDNDTPTLAGVSDDSSQNIRPITLDPSSGALQVNLETSLNKDDDSITTYEKGCQMTVIDLATDAATVVSAVPCVLLGIYVNIVMSAHSCPIIDDATTKITLPASLAAGTNLDFHSAIFATNLSVNSNDAATGEIVVFTRAI